MKKLACRLAWRVLWRYWPDREFIVEGAWDWDTGRPGYHVHLSALNSRARPGSTVIEKLDHFGKRSIIE